MSEQRKSIGNYTEYLKQKSMKNSANDKNYDYLQCFNRAVYLINNNKKTEGVDLLIELIKIKYDPDVFKLIQENADQRSDTSKCI